MRSLTDTYRNHFPALITGRFLDPVTRRWRHSWVELTPGPPHAYGVQPGARSGSIDVNYALEENNGFAEAGAVVWMRHRDEDGGALHFAFHRPPTRGGLVVTPPDPPGSGGGPPAELCLTITNESGCDCLAGTYTLSYVEALGFWLYSAEACSLGAEFIYRAKSGGGYELALVVVGTTIGGGFTPVPSLPYEAEGVAVTGDACAGTIGVALSAGPCGGCDETIGGGGTLCFGPDLTLHFGNTFPLSLLSGACPVFGEIREGDGIIITPITPGLVYEISATGGSGGVGPAGPAGPAGSAGAAGSPGSVWRDGSGAPSSGLGINGDYYLDTATGDVYFKAGGAYSVVGNIKGATGATGATGSAGATGATGATGAAGPNTVTTATTTNLTGFLVGDGANVGVLSYPLAIAKGGTNADGTGYVASGALYYNGTRFATTAAATNGQVLVGQTGSAPLWKAVSGDLTLDPLGVATLAGNALAALKGLTPAADRVPRFTGAATADLLTFSTDGTLAGNSDTALSSQKAVKTYVDNAVTGLLDFKGSTSCSANPNYPAASKGDAYVVSAAGKIGGASGKSVDVGDVYVASADNAGGTEAAVGTSWFVLEHNLVGALLSANNLSDVASAATALANLSGVPTSRTLSTTAPLTGGGDLSANRTLAISDFVAAGGSAAAGTVPSPGATAFTNNPRILGSQAAWVKHSGKVLGVSRVSTQQSTVSTTPADLTTVQSLSVPLDESTDVLIWAGAWVVNNAVAGAAGSISANVNAANTTLMTTTCINTSSAHALIGMLPVTLAAGANTIKLQFFTSAGTAFFADRWIIVMLRS